MDFGMHGQRIIKESELQNQGTWIPVTPAKPTPTSPQLIYADREGSQLGRTNWLHSMGIPTGHVQQSTASSSREAVACFDPTTGSMDTNRGFYNWEAALAGRNRATNHIVGSYAQALTDNASGWNNIPFVDLLAMTNVASASSAAAATSTIPQRSSFNMGTSSFYPQYHSPIDGSHHWSYDNASLLLASQDCSFGSNLWNSNNCPSETPQYGFPAPCQSTYDLNSQPRGIAGAVPHSTISLQQHTQVAYQAERKENNQLSDIVNWVVNERSYQEKDKQENPVAPTGNEVTILPCDEEVSQPIVDSSSAAFLTSMQEIHNCEKEGDHGIDLNKTPEQKSRRKKHRPKVIREAKPKKTPKPVTPKCTNATPSGKRKYVRKNVLKASATPSTNEIGGTVDPTLISAVKSCKRTLNFDLESHKGDENHGTTVCHQERLQHSIFNSSSCGQDCNLNVEPQAPKLPTSKNGNPEMTSTVKLRQGTEMVVEKTQAGTQAGIVHDLTHSMSQMPTDYVSLPENHAPKTPQCTMKRMPTENVKVLARNRNDDTRAASACQDNEESGYRAIYQQFHVKGTGQVVLPARTVIENHVSGVQLQRGPHLIPTRQNDPNCYTNAQLSMAKQTRGSKRECCHTLDKMHIHTTNLARAHYNSLQSYQERTRRNEDHNSSGNFDPHFPELYKKQRTEMGDNAALSGISSSISTAEDCSGQATKCSGNGINKSHCESQAITCGKSAPELSNANTPKKLNNLTSGPMHSGNAFSIASTCNFAMQKSFAGLNSCTEAESRYTLDNPQLPQCSLTSDHTEIMTKKQSKGFTQTHSLAFLTATARCNQPSHKSPKQSLPSSFRQGNEIAHRPQAFMEPLIAANLAKLTKKRTKKGPSQVNSVLPSSANELHLQENKKVVYDYHQSEAKSRGTQQIMWIYVDPIDEIVQRLKQLDLSGDSDKTGGEVHNALVPYCREGTMVPYEGPFDPTKKRRQRPKVDLDPESSRVWKLLMGKESSEGSEGTDIDKEKWWENERKVFQGRADSFIARMHLVQGDRRFSEWKGSVVDSVIGVFLTQNVSDHLSSSAYMSLASRFPLKSTRNHRTFNAETSTLVEEPEVCILESDEIIKWHEPMSNQQACDQSSMTLHEADHIEESEVANSQESFGSNMGGVNSTEKSKGKQLVVHESRPKMSNGSQGNTDTLMIGTGSTSLVEADDRAVEDAVSSQNESSVIQTSERNGSCSDSNSEAEDQITGCKTNCIDDSTSFMELLQMAETTTFKEIYSFGSWSLSHTESSTNEHKQSEGIGYIKNRSSSDSLGLQKNSSVPICSSNSQQPQTQVPIIPSNNYHLNMTPDSGILEVKFLDVFREESRSLPSSTSEIIKTKEVDCINSQCDLVGETINEYMIQQKVSSSAQEAPTVDPSPSLERYHAHTVCSSQPEAQTEKNLNPDNDHQEKTNYAFQSKGIQVAEPRQTSNLPICSGECLEVESSTLLDKDKPIESNTKEQVYSSGKTFSGMNTDMSRAKKGRVARKENNAFDWDSLRRQVYANGGKRERSDDTMDSVDWETVRCADVHKISDSIKERGMNNMLAERIKGFLNRVVRDHGSIDLEWLRDIPPHKAKEYLLSIRGLGLKSVECVRLLRLHHLAFPVDTNVGRIAVRLGWVPLQPLPESLQLHLLELYPMLESIQKYLWPRLCTMDQRTLYELHYQMITFGKVFCTKNKPNCNACPMRAECKHFASAFASARLALPGPEEKSIVSSTVPIVAKQGAVPVKNPMLLPLPGAEPLLEARPEINVCEPIIEEPATPEPESTEVTIGDIEDAFYEDPDEIPTIKLNVEEFTMNLQNYMQENNMGLQEGDMSKALVTLTSEAASIPMPKLKNVSRLRTEHQVYELPDSHLLLNGLDRREPGDPCSYLLAIWTPGETANSIQPPKKGCSTQESGQLCNEETCFSCNSIREANSQTVRGTLLIPCRTAMRGSFPLNGTYFQVNEVFADHESSLNPIYVPRAWIWDLPRRTVYFGSSVSSIFKGLSTEEIQYCFWRAPTILLLVFITVLLLWMIIVIKWRPREKPKPMRKCKGVHKGPKKTRYSW